MTNNQGPDFSMESSIWKKVLTYRVIKDLAQTQDYLRRWSLWLPFGWSVKVHQIVRPDDDRCEHDHPWWFIRVILWGGYTEKIRGKEISRKPWRPWAFWRIYPCWPSFRHRITSLPMGSSWTLILCGSRSDSWGFFTRSGWVYWRNFVNEAMTARILWCDDGTTVEGVNA